MNQVAAALDEDISPSAIGWLDHTVETESPMDEITGSTPRISHLVDAVKRYSRLDRAPFRHADAHELLDSTLLMLSGKIGKQIEVVKDHDRTPPRIPAYPAEPNRCGRTSSTTSGEGALTVRTAPQHDRLLVEFRDPGVGIPAQDRERTFDPFFTTKPVGEGSGLGLDISWRTVVTKHHGSIQVESEPGGTRLRVQLPLTALEEESA